MAISKIIDPIKTQFARVKGFLAEKIFGHNNERLDLIMDTFNKLSPERRNLTSIGIILMVVILVAGIFFLYFFQLGKLQNTLSSRKFDNSKLSKLGTDFGSETAKFDGMVNVVRKKVQGLRIKAELERIANGVGVNIDSIDESTKEFDSENPLNRFFKSLDAEVRVSKTSIPELLELLVSIEKANRMFQVSDLRISGLYKTKLHFEAMFRVQGIVNSEG